GLRDHLDVVFGFEQRPDAAADQRLVVGQQDPDQDGARAGSSAHTWKPPLSCGPAWSRPPSADTRSPMPTRPRPGPDALVPVLGPVLVPVLVIGPLPSSSTWIERVSRV